MRPNDCLGCLDFPCQDVNHGAYQLPGVDIDPQKVSIMMISEAAPVHTSEYYYAEGNPFFAQTTIQMFREAGEAVGSIADILGLGVYLTTAVKCGKTSYTVQAETIQACAQILEQEVALFPNLKAFLLMGDVAIKAMNAVARRSGQPRVIPGGPTYKIRQGTYHFQGRRAFPSYLQVGPSFFIEKGKHRVVAEDIAAALAWCRGQSS